MQTFVEIDDELISTVIFHFCWFKTGCLGGSIRCVSDWWSGGSMFDPGWVQQHSFVKIDHEIFATIILSLLQIQEGQLSVFGERMCASTG